MKNPNIRTLFIALFGVMIFGSLGSFLFDTVTMFHMINPIAISLGFLILIVYSGGWYSAWENRFQEITPAHMLTFGVTLNWLGLILRLGRWFFTTTEPSGSEFELWFYNLGLWISIWAGLFLLGAAQLVTRVYKIGTLITIFLLICGFLYWVDQTDIFAAALGR